MTALAFFLFVAPPTTPACVLAASEYYRLGDFLPAARTAQVCWDLTHHLRVLLVGCQARERLGHFAHAARMLALYDAHATAESSMWSRESAEALRATIREHTGTIQLVVSPPPSTGEHLRFELIHLDDLTREPLTGDLAELERAKEAGFVLDAGRWSVALRREHHEPVRREITIAVQTTTPLSVNMRRLDPPPAVQLTARPTRLHLGPARALHHGIELHLRLADSTAELVHVQYDPDLTLHLTPGQWHLIARARGHAPRHAKVEPGAALDLQLRPGAP